MFGTEDLREHFKKYCNETKVLKNSILCFDKIDNRYIFILYEEGLFNSVDGWKESFLRRNNPNDEIYTDEKEYYALSDFKIHDEDYQKIINNDKFDYKNFIKRINHEKICNNIVDQGRFHFFQMNAKDLKIYFLSQVNRYLSQVNNHIGKYERLENLKNLYFKISYMSEESFNSKTSNDYKDRYSSNEEAFTLMHPDGLNISYLDFKNIIENKIKELNEK